MKPILFCLLVLTTLFSCKSKSTNSEHVSYDMTTIDLSAPSSTSMEHSPAMNAPALETVNFSPPNIKDDLVEGASAKATVNKKKIIKDGSITTKAKDITASKKGIDETIKKLNAYYEVEELDNNDLSVSYNLKIRVPSLNFEKLISAIESGTDEITNKSIQARDVTEEFMDIETRLSNKREYLKKYRELLSKAAKVDDILAIEENIRVLQEEIESSEGRLKYLSDQVAYSTLNLTLYKEKAFVYKAPEQDKFSERVKKSLGSGWNSVVNFALWLITVWPFTIVFILLWVVIKWIIKRRRNKQQ